MCGQVGIAGKLSSTFADIFTELLYIDALRGKDGTGVALYSTHKKSPIIIKAPTQSAEFLDSSPFCSAFKNPYRLNVLLGHNRAATKGKLEIDHTHPFLYGHIVLAHNGTLWNKGGLTKWDHPVDSANIAHNMEKMGEQQALEGLSGAFSLVWINTTTQTLNFARNSDRPLFIANIGDDRVTQLVWASEARMLKFVLDGKAVKTRQIWQPKPHFWFKVDLKNLSMQATAFKPYIQAVYREQYQPEALYTLEPYEKHQSSMYTRVLDQKGTKTSMMPESFLPYERDPTHGVLRGWAYLDVLGGRFSTIVYNAPSHRMKQEWTEINLVGAIYTGGSQVAAICQFPSELEPLPSPLPVGPDVILGWNGLDLSNLTEFYRATQKGCSQCSCRPRPSQGRDLHWTSKDTFLCGTCHLKSKTIPSTWEAKAKRLLEKYGALK